MKKLLLLTLALSLPLAQAMRAENDKDKKKHKHPQEVAAEHHGQPVPSPVTTQCIPPRRCIRGSRRN